ncbi:DegT/DnrJ/EryC1/StrS family aminotransferase [Bradyrhizobium sediminis]|uniref:DegT/DnrJ/EryC1/StrS family aminotransferase n=1 Tax=Bradyrhizobium sediminis TaxID=2840469 RepID=A0A975NGT5_9BRAD|nr:DegT/DnrJ/EryC1/StrS family aminotransferase [Bradyrhizobium sediminis]QWG14873.1 DegT/DnrJ/EryC1/StrS family aminotransferase [Bradyrhizobium sediminis]
MKTFPRYLPAIDLHARFAALTRVDTAAAYKKVLVRLGVEEWRQIVPVARARVGITAYFRELAVKDARRSVLLSAQICPLVPKILLRLGFHPVFIDVDEGAPMPGEDQILSALCDLRHTDSVAAIIIAPIYGYLPMKLDEVAQRLKGIAVFLDLAQGTTLAPRLPRLMARADAAVFSFGQGKGVDIGGGLLAVRETEVQFDSANNNLPLTTFAELPAALALQLALKLGIYRHLIPAIDLATEADKSDRSIEAALISKRLPDQIFNAYAERLSRFATEIELGSRRAVSIHEQPAISRHCRQEELFGSAIQMHLRQIVRLVDQDRRGRILSTLRDAGIDALPAGEPLPETYLPNDAMSVVPSSDGLPNTKRFLSDAIRLPFLGRMNDDSFRDFSNIVENAFD